MQIQTIQIGQAPQGGGKEPTQRIRIQLKPMQLLQIPESSWDGRGESIIIEAQESQFQEVSEMRRKRAREEVGRQVKSVERSH